MGKLGSNPRPANGNSIGERLTFPQDERVISHPTTSFASSLSTPIGLKHSLPRPFVLKHATLDFSSPRIMGIINATPDSFHAGSRVQQARSAAVMAERMVLDGADILDVGGQSTRPGADPLNAATECERILPIIHEIRQLMPAVPISVDTYRAEVARKALAAGADIINDIGAANLDSGMEDLLVESGAPCILMHMQGNPQTMQKNPTYRDVAGEVIAFLTDRLEHLHGLGVNQLAIDPGFGFGKTIRHNYVLLDRLSEFHCLQAPILVGVSRKSMIHKVLSTGAEGALNGTTILHSWALDRGAHILRVHDVVEAVECVKLHHALSTARRECIDD